MPETSTKPYLIRAIHEWCTDNGLTPHLAAAVDARTMVPREHVRNGEIVLNVSVMATNKLSLGNEFIEFQARFGGVPRELSIPVENVTAVYARENGHGMAFEVSRAQSPTEAGEVPESPEATPGEAPPQASEDPAARKGPPRRRGSPRLVRVESPPSGTPRSVSEALPQPASLPAPSDPPAMDATPTPGPAMPPPDGGNGPDDGGSAPGRPRLTRIK
jgi:stringent starvation protein B